MSLDDVTHQQRGRLLAVMGAIDKFIKISTHPTNKAKFGIIIK